MGFYFRKKQRDTLDVAQQILEMITSGKKLTNKDAKKIVNNNNRIKKKILLEALSLIENPVTPRELYVTSGIYVLLGADYNTQTIKYLERYIEIGGFFEETPNKKITIHEKKYSQIDTNKSALHICLGKCYEREGKLEKAENAYKEGIKLFDANAVYYVHLANVMKKQNKISEHNKLIDCVKQTVFYAKDELFNTIINDYVVESS